MDHVDTCIVVHKVCEVCMYQSSSLLPGYRKLQNPVDIEVVCHHDRIPCNMSKCSSCNSVFGSISLFTHEQISESHNSEFHLPMDYMYHFQSLIINLHFILCSVGQNRSVYANGCTPPLVTSHTGPQRPLCT